MQLQKPVTDLKNYPHFSNADELLVFGTEIGFPKEKQEAIMKTKLLLSAFLILTSLAVVKAGQVNSVFHIETYNHQPIVVLVDGIKYHAAATHSIVNLSPGIHQIKVFSVRPGRLNWMPPEQVLVYKGFIKSVPGFETFSILNRKYRVVTKEMTAINQRHRHPFAPWNAATDDCVTTPGSGVPSFPGQHGPFPISSADFNQLKQVISTKSFESTKQQIAIQALDNHHFLSEQVLELLYLFTFESTKLEVARHAYNRTIDPQKFYVVYDAFTFESSIRDLQAHLY